MVKISNLWGGGRLFQMIINRLLLDKSCPVAVQYYHSGAFIIGPRETDPVTVRIYYVDILSMSDSKRNLKAMLLTA